MYTLNSVHIDSGYVVFSNITNTSLGPDFRHSLFNIMIYGYAVLRLYGILEYSKQVFLDCTIKTSYIISNYLSLPKNKKNRINFGV